VLDERGKVEALLDMAVQAGLVKDLSSGFGGP
jgi:hypothetical protein